jgi:hypothetical protein
MPTGEGVFVKQRYVDGGYYHDIRRTIPYTDGKGYEVVAPFPWGRYITLRQAIKEFTQSGYIVPAASQPSSDSYVPPDQVQALLSAGLLTPSMSGETVDQLQTYMNSTSLDSFTSSSNSKNDYTIIVLSYAGRDTTSDSQLMQTAQPDGDTAAQALEGTFVTEQQAIDVLVSGDIAPTKATQEVLAGTQTPNKHSNLGVTPADSKQAPPGLPQYGTQYGT